MYGRSTAAPQMPRRNNLVAISLRFYRALEMRAVYPRKKFLIKNPIFAGRSAKRLMKYGNQSFPYGM